MASPKMVEEGSLDVTINFDDYEDRMVAKPSHPSPYIAYPPSVMGVETVPRVHRTVKPSVPVCSISEQRSHPQPFPLFSHLVKKIEMKVTVFYVSPRINSQDKLTFPTGYISS